jgi:hypothetical protein
MCNVLWQTGALLADPRSPAFIRIVVESKWATSYYTEALAIGDVRVWLSSFNTRDLALHAATHPPGPILHYYLWLRLTGPTIAPYAGAATIGLAASLGIPVMYWFASLWTSDRAPRLMACALFAMLPALILFFPQYDQAYPVLAMLMILFWGKALEGDVRYAPMLGLVLFTATFFAYNLLTLGAPMALYALTPLGRAKWERPAVLRVVSATLCALGTATLAHIVLAVSTGYDPLRSFAHALENMRGLNERLGRPYYACVFFDLYDFFLGGGVLTLPLLLVYLYCGWHDGGQSRWPTMLTGACLVSILLVDATGLLRAETARVWLFLQPLAVVPAGLQLARLRVGERAALLGLLWVTLAVMKCKMMFIIVP